MSTFTDPECSARPSSAPAMRRLRFGVCLPSRHVPAGWLAHTAQRLAGPLLALLSPPLRRLAVLDQVYRGPFPQRPAQALAQASQIDLCLSLPAPAGWVPDLPTATVADLAVDSEVLTRALAQAAAGCGLALCTAHSAGPVSPAARRTAAVRQAADLAEAPYIVTLRIDLHTPLPLPVPLGEFTAEALWALAVERLRDWGGAPAPRRADDLAAQLLTCYARQQAATTCRHGVLTGTLFLRAAGPGWLPLLRAVQPLHLVRGPEGGPLAWRGAFQVQLQRGGWLDQGLANTRRLRRLAGADGDDGDLPSRLPEAADPTDPALWQGPAALAAGLADDLKHGRWQPRPTQGIALHRPGKPPRWVERLSRRDALAQRHLLALLGPVCERVAHPASYGFRPGLGRPEALRAVHDAVAAGCTHVAETDIANCFDSIPHAQVWQALDRVLLPADTQLRRALQAALTQACGFDGTPRPRLAGLAQGAPLSPMLCNLVLGGIDKALDGLPVRYVRYADDLVVLAHGKADARRALDRVREAVAALGLALAPDKTRVGHVQEGFSFLGERFDPRSVEPLAAATAAQRKPLVVTWPWLELGVNGPCLEARRAGKPLGRWPLRRLSTLLVLAPASFSTALIERCAAHQVVVGLSLRGGREAVVMPAEQRHHLDRQAAHLRWHGAQSVAERLTLAQALVEAKIANAMALVRQRQPHDTLLDTLHEVQRQLPCAGSTTVLRGHEGYAAKLMFRWLNTQILPTLRPAFASQRRARGAPDRLNSMLNLGYHLLRCRLSIMLRSRALNPYLGWLHDADDNYETLTYDLMEPFRPLVDRLVLRLINRQELRATHFDPTPGEHRLTPEGAGRLVQAFERAMGERVGTHLWRDMLWVQVQAVARLTRGEGAFWVFHWQPRDKPTDAPPPGGEGPLFALGSDEDLGPGNDPALPWWPEPSAAGPGRPDGAAAPGPTEVAATAAAAAGPAPGLPP